MVQPKDAPISFRPGEARLARIEAWAKERKLSRHLAILVLIDAGLRGETADDPMKTASPSKPVQKVEKVAPAGLTFGPKRAGFGDRLKKR